MDANVENLIKMAAEGGSISDRQREIILRKAQEAGVDLDEVQFMMKIAERDAQKEVVNSDTENKPNILPAPPAEDDSLLGRWSKKIGVPKGVLIGVIILLIWFLMMIAR